MHNKPNWLAVQQPFNVLQFVIFYYNSLATGPKRAHVVRVKGLPKDYQIVYHEIQKYLYMIVELTDGIDMFSGVIDLFEEGAPTLY